MMEWLDWTGVLRGMLTFAPPFVAGIIFANFHGRPLVWCPGVLVMSVLHSIAEIIAEGMKP